MFRTPEAYPAPDDLPTGPDRATVAHKLADALADRGLLAEGIAYEKLVAEVEDALVACIGIPAALLIPAEKPRLPAEILRELEGTI